MLEHILPKTTTRPAIPAAEGCDCDTGTSTYLDTLQRNIDAYHVRSRQGLWSILAFLLVSLGALLMGDINLLDMFPENVRVSLGAPPAPYLVHIVLAVSTLSALIIITGRIANETKPGRRWEQVGHRAAFYVFYLFSNSLGDYFTVVFAAGLAVLLLEHYHIWSFFAKAICHERELMRKISLWPLIASSQR